MMARALRVHYSFSSQAQSSVMHPFEFTLYPKQLKNIDSRFREYPVEQKLFPGEAKHIHFVMECLQGYLNKGRADLANKQFLDPRLVDKIELYLGLLREQDIHAEFQFALESLNKSGGYLEYHGWKPHLYMHEYDIERKEEKVILQERAKVTKKGLDQQIQEDLAQIQNQNSITKKIQDQLKPENKFMKKFGFLTQMVQSAKSNLESKGERRKFEPCILTNVIEGKMNFKLTSPHKGPQQIQDLDLVTRWYYQLTYEQPESIKQSRKRVLYDFQLWNRGCMVPIRDFTQSL